MAVIETGHRQDDSDIDVGEGLFNGITPFQNGDIRGESFVQQRVPLCGETHVRDRIGVVVVLTGGIDDEIRLEFVQDGQNDPVEDHEKTLIRGLRGERDVDGRPEGVRPAELVAETGPRIEGPAVLVDGDAQGVRIVPVDVLGAVAVVAVRVHDGDPFRAVTMPDVFNHDRFDVHIAEAAGAVDDEHRVVARRPDQGEGVVHFAGENLVRCGDGAARRDEVRFRDYAARIRDADVRPVDILRRCDPGFVFADIVKVEEAFLEDLILGVEEAFLPFRVVRRNGPVEGGEEDQTGSFSRFQRHRASPRLRSAIQPGLIWTLTRIFFPVV